jgi:hypothetical protein
MHDEFLAAHTITRRRGPSPHPSRESRRRFPAGIRPQLLIGRTADETFGAVIDVKTVLLTGNEAPRGHYADSPESHPEWERYRQLMLALSVPPSSVAASWKLLLSAMRQQADLNRSYPDSGTRPANAGYQQFADMLSALLEIGHGHTIGLWSGGFDVSEYAALKGHVTLEFTALGSILSRLLLHQDWKLISPLWRVLSRKFVELNFGEVHVFVASYDRKSCLMRYEVPLLLDLKSRGAAIVMAWHPVYYGTGNGQQKIREITADLCLGDRSEFSNLADCSSVLIEYIISKDESEHANQNAKRVHRETLQRLHESGGKNGKWMTSKLPQNVRSRRPLTMF